MAQEHAEQVFLHRRLPACSKVGMKLLRGIADWARSKACGIWRLVAPQVGPGVAGGVGGDVARSRRELVLENALLRHQVLILRRKFSPEAHDDRPASPS